jgi:uncharacterized protein YndB with AHSA1/START domain
MTELPHRLDRTVIIQASRDIVFGFFTHDERWAAWWGTGSTIDPRPGGQLRICYPDGTKASGEVLEVVTPERIVFTMGFDSGKPIAPGDSRVTLRLEAIGAETKLHLSHEFAESHVRDEFVQGWRYQLSVFANLVADRIHSGAADVVDAWFAAWSEPNEDARKAAFARMIAPTVQFRDRYSLVEGLTDLVAHTGAAQRFMNLRLTRQGALRHCQGMVVVDWIAVAGDGQERGSGTNVFTLGPESRIETVTGFWNSARGR